MLIYIYNEDEKILYEIPNEPFIEEKKIAKEDGLNGLSVCK